MRRVGLDPKLEERARQAAGMERCTVSELVRRAATERVDRILGDVEQRAERLKSLISVFHGGGGRANRAGDAFTDELLRQRYVPESKKPDSRPHTSEHLERDRQGPDVRKEEVELRERVLAATALSTMEIETVPEADELSRQLDETRAPRSLP